MNLGIIAGGAIVPNEDDGNFIGYSDTTSVSVGWDSGLTNSAYYSISVDSITAIGGASTLDRFGASSFTLPNSKIYFEIRRDVSGSNSILGFSANPAALEGTSMHLDPSFYGFRGLTVYDGGVFEGNTLLLNWDLDNTVARFAYDGTTGKLYYGVTSWENGADPVVGTGEVLNVPVGARLVVHDYTDGGQGFTFIDPEALSYTPPEGYQILGESVIDGLLIDSAGFYIRYTDPV